MTKASVKYKLQYTFSDTSWSRITKTKNLKLKFWTNLHKISVLISSVWEQGWCSGESTRLPPMWPGFKSRRRRHMWVEFVVGSLPCSERFFYGYSGFLVFKNQHFQIPIRSGTHGHVSTSSYELLSAPWLNKLQLNKLQLQWQECTKDVHFIDV